MKSYSQFQADTEGNSGDLLSYVKVPKYLLCDESLSPVEKLLWISIASFQYKSDRPSYPGRKRLAAIHGIKNKTSISRLTKKLQDKGYLDKSFAPEIKRVYYDLYFNSNPENDPFMDNIYEVIPKPSKHNKVRARDG